MREEREGDLQAGLEGALARVRRLCRSQGVLRPVGEVSMVLHSRVRRLQEEQVDVERKDGDHVNWGGMNSLLLLGSY